MIYYKVKSIETEDFTIQKNGETYQFTKLNNDLEYDFKCMITNEEIGTLDDLNSNNSVLVITEAEYNSAT